MKIPADYLKKLTMDQFTEALHSSQKYIRQEAAE
jgi:hypothetical protein